MNYVLCLHRWVGSQALYDEYKLPENLKLRVVCTQESLTSLPTPRCESWEILPSLDDVQSVMNKVESIINNYGLPTLVVALNEGDLITAALIRERWNIAGDDYLQISQFRDKLTMLEVASKQNIISILPAVEPELIDFMIEEYGFPLVLKPRLGTASKGVSMLYSREQFEEHTKDTESMMLQVFCSAPILHVDGWWDGRDIVVATVSKYANNCADFGTDVPLGSIELREGEDEKLIIDKAKHLLKVFSPQKDLVFHLELFDKGNELVFLEIGARVGGAEIPFIWREVRNIDLLGIAWEIQTGASTYYRDNARRLSHNSLPINNMRGAWIISLKNSKLNTELKTLYWEQSQDLKSYASGIYEGSRTRLRFKSDQYDLLAQDVNMAFLQLSEIQ